jgi:hypothetical protein
MSLRHNEKGPGSKSGAFLVCLNSECARGDLNPHVH